jgi:hypothetical protein
MQRVQALITLGLITEQEIWDFVRDMEYQEQMIQQWQEEQYSQADYEADMAHNNVLPF